MNNVKRQRPRPGVTALAIGLTFVVILSLHALPQMRAGQPTGEALRSVLTDPGFWTEQMVPLAAIYVLLLLVFPSVHAAVIRRRGRTDGRLSWYRNRWLVTVAGLIFILGTAVPVAMHLIRGTKSFQVDQLVFIGVMWLLYGGYILYSWLRKPSEEWVHGFETGDHSRSLDERYYLVQGKSATITLYWTLGLLFTAGSLYDILVGKTWPARSLAEFAIIFILWNVIYHRVDKTL